MNEIIKNKKIILICILLVLLSLGLFFLINRKNNVNDELDYVEENITHYEANEYTPIYIDDNRIVNIYFNEYISNMIFNVNEAYNSLNKEYREKKFGSLDKYIEYVNKNLSEEVMAASIDKYNISNVNGNKIFDIYGKYENHYIIKEISIMNYEVYLDDYTINIE